MFIRREPEVERREHLKIVGLRKRNEERVEKFIRNPKTRMMGLDVSYLDNQKEVLKQKRREAQAERQKVAERQKIIQEHVSSIERGVQERNMRASADLRSSWASQVTRNRDSKRAEREEFVSNMAGRIAFAGEDENFQKRVVTQRLTQKKWLDEQIKEQEQRIQSNNAASFASAKHWKKLDAYQMELEKQIHKSRADRHRAVMLENQERARKRKELELLEIRRDKIASRESIEAALQASSAHSRVGPLSVEQLEKIRAEQALQRETRARSMERAKEMKASELRRVRAIATDLARKEDAANRERSERDRAHFEELRRQAESQKNRRNETKEARKQEPAIEDHFFSKFGTSAR